MATNAYAPYPPAVLGDSWVPITEQPYEYSQTQERGYWFNLTATSTVVTARTYVDSSTGVPYDGPGADFVVPAVNIYNAGGEDLGGPIRQVTCAVSGFSAPSSTIIPNTNVVSDLYSPNDSTYIILSGTNSTIYLNFDIASHSAQLSGKRILNVELLYSAFSANGAVIEAGIASSTALYLYTIGLQSTAPETIPPGGVIPSFSMGNYTPFYLTRLTLPTSVEVADIYPFDYASLLRMDTTTGAAQKVSVAVIGIGVFLYYAALRITYCEETRVGVGGRRTVQSPPQLGFGPEGTAYSIPILGMTGGVLSSSAPTLNIGNYVVTTELGVVPTIEPAPPFHIKALHQLYEQEIPGIYGVSIPATTTVGDARVSERTNDIPSISLHTASAVVADSHGYTDQLQAPVYSGVTASQGVVNAATGVGTTYSLARFYARRFGNTDSPLGLRAQASPTTSAQISVADFDELDDITDGWKQVDLTFATNLPTFTTSGVSTWEFFSSTPSGARWEVLGARASSVTGLSYSEIGPNQWLAPTTYGGSTSVATWDQGSGTPTIDFRGDLTLMFATMPQVTGVSVTQQLLEVDVTDECDQAPGGIPTGVYYNQVLWSQVPTITGFGGYELQRQDAWTDWQTIMLASSVAVTGFSDFEARVGIQSDYRIRACHELDFCGPWSATVSTTIPVPGVTGTNVSSSVLLFTSNSRQDGSDTLAYSEIFDGTPAETFTFLEAAGVNLQPMYNRDYQVAYHGTERGGESFSRVILTNNAAVALINFEQGFQALRDLAWDSVPYVCVRDNHGSRWLASVTVPTGTIQPPGNSLQFAGITVTEVTATPYPVDPS